MALLFLFFQLYVLLAASCTSFWVLGQPQVLDFYFLSLLALIPALSIYFHRQNKNRFEWRDWLYVLPLILISGFLRYWILHKYSVWFDEEAEVGLWYTNTGSGVWGAGLQNQPPLEYLLTNFHFNWFGRDVFALRFTSLLLGSLVPALSWVVFRRLGLGRWPSFTLALLLALNLWLIRYSVEARGLSAAVFAFLLTSYFFIECWRNPRSRTNQWFLGTASFYFLCLLGLQPEVIIASFGLAGLGVLMKYRRRSLALLLPILGAALFFSPLAIQVTLYSREWFHSSFSLAQTQWPSWADTAQFMNELARIASLDGAWGLAIALMLSLLLWNRSRQNVWTGLALLWPVTYILVLWVGFKTLINYPLRPHYAFTFAPLMILSLALLWTRLPKDKFCNSLITILLLSTPLRADWPSLLHGEDGPTERAYHPFDELYQELKMNTRPGDRAYFFHLLDEREGFYPAFIGSELYYPFEENLAQLRGENIHSFRTSKELLVKDFAAQIPTRDILLVFCCNKRIRYPAGGKAVGWRNRNMVMFTLKGPGAIRERLKKFFWRLDHKLPDAADFWLVREILYSFAQVENDTNAIQFYKAQLSTWGWRAPKTDEIDESSHHPN